VTTAVWFVAISGVDAELRFVLRPHVGLVWAVGKYMWGKSKDTEVPGQAREIWLCCAFSEFQDEHNESDRLFTAVHIGVTGASLARRASEHSRLWLQVD
jgi:hypothetical protein